MDIISLIMPWSAVLKSSAAKTGYNTVSAIVNVILGDTVTQNFTLTQPTMVINPLYIEETLNPDEYMTISMNVLNNGNGPLNWDAEINYTETAPAPAEQAPLRTRLYMLPMAILQLAKATAKPSVRTAAAT